MNDTYFENFSRVKESLTTTELLITTLQERNKPSLQGLEFNNPKTCRYIGRTGIKDGLSEILFHFSSCQNRKENPNLHPTKLILAPYLFRKILIAPITTMLPTSLCQIILQPVFPYPAIDHETIIDIYNSFFKTSSMFPFS